MANSLTAVTPKLLALGLLALRQQSIMPRLVNRRYETLAGARGSTIDVPIPSAVAARDVAPAQVPPAPVDSTPTSVGITLDFWKEAPFFLTDKDVMEADGGILPMQASESIKSLANAVDQFILGLYRGDRNPAERGIFNIAGAAATTPFATDTTAFKNARKLLNKETAPLTDRFVVLDADAEANAFDLGRFAEIDKAGMGGTIQTGRLGERYGANWFLDQNVRTHTSTPLSGGATTVNGAHAVGVATVSIAKATASTPLVRGDILTFSGDTNTYVVLADVTLAVGNTNVSIYPGLRVSKAGGETVTLTATHVVNILSHRDAIAFASRPLADVVDPALGGIVLSEVDPISGLALRLEITRQHRQVQYSYDILCGGELIRPEFACRIMG
jgi:hypothetical protein